MTTQGITMFGIRHNAQQQKEAFELPANIKAVFNQLARVMQVSIQGREFGGLFTEALIEHNAPENLTRQEYQRHRERTQPEAERASRTFQQKATQRGRFAKMIADWTMSPLEMAYTARTPWTGGWDDFDITEQNLVFNGQKISTLANQWPSSVPSETAFNIVFALCGHTSLHESTHMFITMLNGGRGDTPPRMKGALASPSDTIGESGDWGEKYMWTSSIGYARAPDAEVRSSIVCSI
ncbi:hypothetical protein M433DRAFT_454866 [Acidomyces richmondensis BFW]|nr:hypothetical protein M433DRAFT_454866 [Acidomyces richmondensis BFW]